MKIQSPSSNILNQTQQTGNKLLEQLATGKKVNSAADDAAALQIIDRLTSQQSGYSQAVNNAYDGISYSQATESNLSNVNDPDVSVNTGVSLPYLSLYTTPI